MSPFNVSGPNQVGQVEPPQNLKITSRNKVSFLCEEGSGHFNTKYTLPQSTTLIVSEVRVKVGNSQGAEA